jgi:hypothetical protein
MTDRKLKFKLTIMPMRDDARARINHVITRVRLAIIEGVEMESDTDDGYVTMCQSNAISTKALKEADPGFGYIDTSRGTKVAPSSVCQRLAKEMTRFILRGDILVHDQTTPSKQKSKRVKVTLR